MNQELSILVSNNLVSVADSKETKVISIPETATIIKNLTYYGYALSPKAFDALQKLSLAEATIWWAELDQVLKKITFSDRKMGSHVVYQNFPAEVLNMSEGEYWFNQILMYWGFPNALFTQMPEKRELKIEKITFKVLQLADEQSLKQIASALLESPSKWIRQQEETVKYLVESLNLSAQELSKIPFKENLVCLVKHLMDKKISVDIKTATDVLRLSAALSEQDISLRTKVKFKNFSRPQRQYLLAMLEKCVNLQDDFARKPAIWKHLMKALRPGDYAHKYPLVVGSYDLLYKDKLPPTFNGSVESKIKKLDTTVLQDLLSRPGDFTRRLNQMIHLFDDQAVDAFLQVIPGLKTMQLLKLRGFLATVNDRSFKIFPPNGNWTKAQVIGFDSKKNGIDKQHQVVLLGSIRNEISKRVKEKVPSVNIDLRADKIKLPTNDADLAPYGRGTAFAIPDDVTFLRTASYWQVKSSGNVWYDNGWNFFDANWANKGSCCWNHPDYSKAAIFSGDPTSAKTADGKACQMIDLYIDKLKALGVRYAVWNILCFSKMSFNKADVVAALQWGNNPKKGELFDPARCHLSFQLKGENLTKYIAYLDLETREIIYLDANLYGNVQSANNNGAILTEKMPAFLEYVKALPTVMDLFEDVPKDQNGLRVAYDDTQMQLDGEDAYVFLPRNKKNNFKKFELNQLLS